MNLPGFVGPAYSSISQAINAQRSVNLRLEVDLANGKKPVSLIGLPGYRSVKNDLPAGEVRAFWKAQSRTFVVVANILYELFADLTHAVRGTIQTNSGIASITDNGLHMLVVDGFGVLALTLATNATTTLIENFPPGATHIITIDSTMLALEAGSQRFGISAVGDGLTWRAIDFASVEGLPDNLVAIVAHNRQAYMLGTESLQIFWNSGDATRPFIPVEGSFFEVGCIAIRSPAKDETGVYWLGADQRGGARVYRATGGQVVPVSTPAMDAAFAGSNRSPPYVLSDAIGMTFRIDGHVMYALTFPTTSATWLYDATTEGWSELLEWDAEWTRSRLNCITYAFGRLVAGDMDNGKLYEVASNIYANDGRVQRALRASAHVSKDQALMSYANIQVVCEQGVGLESGEDPQMMLRTSKDGGFTFTPEMTRSVGKVGGYGARTRWNRPCGNARDVVFEVSMTDPVKRVWIQAVVNQD